MDCRGMITVGERGTQIKIGIEIKIKMVSVERRTNRRDSDCPRSRTRRIMDEERKRKL